jgi:quinol monooxygenase YgiN
MPILHTAHLRVRLDIVDNFLARLLRHAAISLDREPGCHRFDIQQECNDPTLFLLVEEYADEAALQAHRDSPHYQAFRNDVQDWVVERQWWFWERR